jgi:hypothetical protein
MKGQKKKVRFSKSIFTAKNAIMIFCEKYFIRRNTNSLSPFLGKIVTEETLQHSIETLQHTEVKEANILPDKYDLLKERIEDNLAQDVQSFDTASLKTVTTYESSGIEMFKVHFFPFFSIQPK